MSLLLSFRILNSFRPLHTTALHHAESKAMKKLLKGSIAKKKAKFVESAQVYTPNVFSKGSYEGKRSPNSKRAAVLNKLFMKNITDLMITSENAAQFQGYGIEIHKVQVTPDFKTVNVYWLASGSAKDIDIEKLLEKNASILRHELSQLRVVGNVPKIKFLKDLQLSHITELNRRLGKADFGDDYIPTDPNEKLKMELELHTALTPDMKEKIQTLSTSDNVEDEETDLPMMPDNILGLSHSEIFMRVQATVQKSKAIHRKLPDLELENKNLSNNIAESINQHPVQYANSKVQSAAFKEFLHKRQVLRAKTIRGEKNFKPELDYLQEEYLNEIKSRESNYNFDMFYKEEDDFIEEDVYEKN